LLVLGVAFIEIPFETPKLAPIFLFEGKTHFGDEFWNSDKHGELVILPPGVSDNERANALKRSKSSLRHNKR